MKLDLASVPRLLDKAARTATVKPTEHLTRFLGTPVDAPSFGITGIHHTAHYIGEYQTDAEVRDFAASLSRSPGLSDVRFGPSHISPRFYSVPGYWINLRSESKQVEFFTCLATAVWTERPIKERDLIMSHVGLRVRSAELVRPLLNFLSTLGSPMRILHYEEADAIGHTYGHLQHTGSGAVMELVHERDIDAPHRFPNRSPRRNALNRMADASSPTRSAGLDQLTDT